MERNHVEEIYNFAREKGYRITELSSKDRHNRKGAYSIVEVTLLVDRSDDRKSPLARVIDDLEAELDEAEEKEISAEAQKDEV